MDKELADKKLANLINSRKVEFVDLRFTDTVGKHHHVTLPVAKFDQKLVSGGKPFDGSSIKGWKGIEDSDMMLRIDTSTAYIDPFRPDVTVNIMCDVENPDGSTYNRCPRSLAKRAQEILGKTGIADAAFFGPELEFFIFDNVRWHNNMGDCFYEIDSREAAWGTGDDVECNGHRPQVKGGYFPVPPVDSLNDLRSEICKVCVDVGLKPEVHHHEVATAGQCEIGTVMGEACIRGDHNQIFKYVTWNVAQRLGKVATFMPKPLAGDNGSGMHVHMSLVKNGKNLFSGNSYSGLSEKALHYIGGILKHSKALNAFTNPSTNSYKRLIPGFEAPTILGYSARNRSVSIRIPHITDPKQRRIEVRYPDCTANPYLAFSSMLCAGLDGIKHKIDPGKPLEGNLYAMPERAAGKLSQVSVTLNDALQSLDDNRKFLTADGIFDNDMIDAYIDLKIEESRNFRAAPHPIEFDMYFAI